MKFVRFLRRVGWVHWPQACAAQGMGYVTLASIRLFGLESRVSAVCMRVGHRLWDGLKP